MTAQDKTDSPIRLFTGEMSYGPHAVARHQGKVVFVRGAAPQEEVDVIVREERRKYAFADILAVIRPSEQRRSPPCPYLPRCGGCPWQQLNYAAQLAAKRRIIGEQLRRIGGVEIEVQPVLPSPHEFGYRSRIKLRAANGEVGFYAAASHTLVAIDNCLLAEPDVNDGIAAARALVRALAMPTRRVEILTPSPAGTGLVIVGEIEGAWNEHDEDTCRSWLDAFSTVRGLALHGRGWQRSWGDVAITVEPEVGLELTAHAPAFTQVNPAANRLLVDTVVRFVAVQPGEQVLDLYAGIGNLSLPLRRRGATVVAVERDRQAAQDAVANAARHQGPPLRVLTEPAERAVARLAAAGERFDAVVLDPPRSGAAECLPAILQMAPARLVYVSCDAATLARDLAVLASRYRVETVQPLDLFPHTYHVETVVRARLSCDTRTPGVSSARRHESAEPSRRRRTRGRT